MTVFGKGAEVMLARTADELAAAAQIVLGPFKNGAGVPRTRAARSAQSPRAERVHGLAEMRERGAGPSATAHRGCARLFDADHPDASRSSVLGSRIGLAERRRMTSCSEIWLVADPVVAVP